MKRIKVIILFALICLCCRAEGDKQKIALLEPRVGEGTTSVTGMEKAMVRGELRKAIVNIDGFEAVTRADIDQMMKEHNFQRTGMVSEAQIKRLGVMSGADYICVSTLTKSDTEFYLEAYLIHLETGTMSNPASQYGELVDGKLANLFPACQALAKELLTGRMSSAGQKSRNNAKNAFASKSLSYTETALGVNMNMVWVEGGEFQMGCTPDQGGECKQDEKNVRTVTLTGYYIGAFEVTQAQWEKVMGTTIYQQKITAGYNSLYGTGSDYPMYYVSYAEAAEFCRLLSKHTGKKCCLPTEAQWEYAARGGQDGNTKFAGSNGADEVAWHAGNSKGTAQPCGDKNPNSLGLYDMSGNVSEWCADWYSSRYDNGDTDNPAGSQTGDFRVLRGGNWDSKAQMCRVACRQFAKPNYHSYLNGFRVVCIP